MPSTWSPEQLGPGTKHMPNLVCALAEYLKPEPEWLRPGKYMKRGASFGQALQSTPEPEQCRARKHTLL